jgi:hypothetical protein
MTSPSALSITSPGATVLHSLSAPIQIWIGADTSTLPLRLLPNYRHGKWRLAMAAEILVRDWRT